MGSRYATPTFLADRHESTSASVVRQLVLALAGAVGIALGAMLQIRLPMTEVPLTLQTFAVLMCGFLLRPMVAISATMIYLFMGIPAALNFSVPAFFATSGGIFGFTAGYLVAFLIAAPMVAVISGGLNGSLARQLVAGIAGSLTVLALGFLGLVLSGKHPVVAAFYVGVVPFIFPAILKLGMALAAVRAIRKFVVPSTTY